MSGSIHGLCWFPHFPDKFVTWGGQDITLMRIPSNDNKRTHLLNLSDCFVAIENRYQYARCVQASYHKDRPIIAIGQGDGKICISNFQETVDSNWEYTPRQQRLCMCLAWNELDPNILAIGHDRHRSDSGITIWDVSRGPPKEAGAATFLGNAESAHSMCWDKNHRVLIAGLSQKQIKLFDLRQNSAACQSVQTKMVNGLGVAPNGNYLCSYLDSIITLWDLRSLERPLKQIQSPKNHFQLSWCPTRSLLSSLQRDSPYVTLYDIRSVDVEAGREICFVKKQLMPFHHKHHTSTKGNALTSLAWHPTDFERALLLSEAGLITDFRLPVTILTAYSNRPKLPILLDTSVRQHPPTDSSASSSSSSNGAGYTVDTLDSELGANDLVAETWERALRDYGLKMGFARFGDLHLSAYLKNVWLTLRNVYRDEKLTGLKTVLGVGVSHTSEALMASPRVESQILQWPDFINKSSHLICYRNEQRDLALKLCGWTFEQDLDRFVDVLCENKEFSRAAMICVFHMKLLTACDILSKAADASRDPSIFRIAAVALSSFNADRCSSTWRNQRSNANMQIQDAHLRTIFSFLTIENDNFDAVLAEEGISLGDRVAFACKYLSESHLNDFIKKQILKSIEKGDLNGLLLTGESLEGVQILQAYVDSTSDVQTVALIAINYFHHEHFQNESLQYWITSYMDCLNTWGLWEKRAELEIKIENTRTSTRSQRSVFLSCNFCGKSVSTALQEDARMRNASSNVNKLSSCPSCRKPLPRCSLCLLHMGTMQSTPLAGGPNQENLGWQSKHFSKWFSWCQTCRHGGHTEHIMQWFKQNSECPVSSCSCRCFDLDATIPDHNIDIG